MKLKSIIAICSIAFFLSSCGSDETKSNDRLSAKPEKKTEAPVKKAEPETKKIDIKDIPDVDPMTQKGIGPVKSLTLGALDEGMAAEGKEIYNNMCKACHKPTKKYIGPAPLGVLDRRTPEWIMNMILNPEQMVKEDPIAMKLLAEYNSPMANQNLTEEEARKVLEYFRTLK